MLVLIIDTATPELCVGLVAVSAVAEPTVRAQQELANCKRHNEVLIPTVQETLQAAGCTLQDLGAIIVGTGPGPFTGLRVGMATASALGHALGIPVYGVCTHYAMAQQMPQPALVITDARRREIYWTVYGDVMTTGPEVCAPADLELPESVAAYTAPEHIALPEAVTALPHVAVTFRPADWVQLVDFSQPPAPLVPLYLRRPDAKEPQPVHFEYALGPADQGAGASQAGTHD